MTLAMTDESEGENNRVAIQNRSSQLKQIGHIGTQTHYTVHTQKITLLGNRVKN